MPPEDPWRYVERSFAQGPRLPASAIRGTVSLPQKDYSTESIILPVFEDMLARFFIPRRTARGHEPSWHWSLVKMVCKVLSTVPSHDE